MSLEARMKQQKKTQKVPSKQAAIIISKTINIILFFNVVNVFFLYLLSYLTPTPPLVEGHGPLFEQNKYAFCYLNWSGDS